MDKNLKVSMKQSVVHTWPRNVVYELSLAIKGKCSCYENNGNDLSNRYCVKQDGQITVNMTSIAA